MLRAIGALPQACSAKRLWTTSSGSSSCIAISSRMTSRSASTSSAASVELVTMSPSTSMVIGRSSSRTRAWKQVYSLAVKALNSPPTASRDAEMSMALRSPVPLNNRCSRKCEQPCCFGVSSAEPTPTQTPTLADRIPGICSVITRRPPGRRVRRTSPSSDFIRVLVAPTFWADDNRPADACWPVDVGWSDVTPRMPQRAPQPARPRPGSATACRGRRSRRSGPGSSGPPRRRPRPLQRACRPRANGAC